MPKQGKIIIPPDTNIWQHEHKTAKSLARAGFTVKLIRKSTHIRATSADVYINKEKWEMKAPTSSNIKAIRRNLKEARQQSDKIIFDSHRIKHIPDEAILRELTTQSKSLSGISKLKFINHHGNIYDIKK